MARRSASWMDLWTAPYDAFRVMREAAETMTGAQTVIARRLPTLMEAAASPWTADLPELSLMVTEKLGAAGSAAGSARRGAGRLRKAMDGQTAAMRRLAAQGWLSPMDWWDVGQRNLTIATTMMALPREVLAPFRKGVTGNVRRLEGSRGRETR